MESSKRRTLRLQGIPESLTHETLLANLRRTFGSGLSLSAPRRPPYESAAATRSVIVSKAVLPEIWNAEIWEGLGKNATRHETVWIDGVRVTCDMGCLGLSTLWEPEESSNIAAEVIACHGLSGHAVVSWTSRQTGECWLSEFLGPDCKTLRVMTYGYDFHLVNGSSDSQLDDYAIQLLNALATINSDKPLILFGHSYGGIVIATALDMLDERSDSRDPLWAGLLDRIKLVVFFGTPQQGVNLEMFRSHAEKHVNSNSRIGNLGDVRENAPFLRVLRRSMRRLGGIKLVTCVEQEHQPGSLHVDRLRASIGLMNEDIIPIVANHQNMNTFDSPTNPGYQAILLRVRLVLDKLENPPLFSLDDESRSTLFALAAVHDAAHDSQRLEHYDRCLRGTRTTVMNAIELWTVEPNSSAKSTFWLSGMAGTGKSTIALTFAKEAKEAGRLGASFFFTRGAGDLSSAVYFFRTLAYQLSYAFPPLGKFIAQALRENPDLTTKTMERQWEGLILEPLKKVNLPRPLVIVVDALDECDNDMHTASLIYLLQSSPPPKLRVLITSRPEFHIGLNFRKGPTIQHFELILHDQPRDEVDSDIKAFLQNRLELIAQERDLPKGWLTEETILRLVHRSGGLFIFAATVCRYLRDQQDKDTDTALARLLAQDSGALSRTSDELSATEMLDTMYVQVVEIARPTTSTKASDDFLRFLRCFAALQDELSLGQLAKFFSVSEEIVRERLKRLGSVLLLPGPSETNRPVRIFHASFRDFARTSTRWQSPSLAMDVPTQRLLAHHCISALSTLKYDICSVMVPGARRELLSQAQVQEKVPAHVAYACTNLLDHVLANQDPLIDEGEIHHFFKKNFLNWLEALSWLRKLSVAVADMTQMKARAQDDNANNLAAFLQDGYLFLNRNRFIIDLAPLQVYHSAFLFTPSENLVKIWCDSSDSKKWVRFPQVPRYGNGEILRLEHSENVSSVDFGKDCIVTCCETAVCLWNAHTGEQLRSLALPEVFRSPRVKFSSPHDVLITCKELGVLMWDVQSGQIRRYPGTFGTDTLLTTFLSDRKTLLTYAPSLGAHCRDRLQLWDMKFGRKRNNPELTRLNLEMRGLKLEAVDVAMSRDGGYLAASDLQGTVVLMEVSSGTITKKLEWPWPLDSVDAWMRTMLALSAKGRLLARTTIYRTILLRNVQSGLDLVIDVADSVSKPLFSSSGDYVASMPASGPVRLWDTKTGKEVQRFGGPHDKINDVAFSPDDKYIICASTSNVRLWPMNPGDFEPVALRKGVEENVTDAISWLPPIFSASGKLLATHLVYENKLMVENLDIQELHFSMPWTTTTSLDVQNVRKQVTAVILSPDDSAVALGFDDASMELWSLRSREILWRCTTLFVDELFFDSRVAFSPDGQKLAYLQGNSLTLLDGKTGKTERLVHHIQADSTKSAEAEAPKKLEEREESDTSIESDASRGPDGPEMSEESEFVSGEGLVIFYPYWLAFSPNGDVIAGGHSTNRGSCVVRLWETSTGRELRVFGGRKLFFAPNSTTMASVSGDGDISLWFNSSEEFVTEMIPSGFSPETSVAFSSDSRLLAAISDRNELQIWTVQPTTLMHTIVETAFEKDRPYIHGKLHLASSLKFAPDDLSIETSIGQFLIENDHVQSKNGAPIRTADLELNDTWIRYQGQDLLWLPFDRRAYRSAYRNGYLVIQDNSGRVSVYRYK